MLNINSVQWMCSENFSFHPSAFDRLHCHRQSLWRWQYCHRMHLGHFTNFTRQYPSLLARSEFGRLTLGKRRQEVSWRNRPLQYIWGLTSRSLECKLKLELKKILYNLRQRGEDCFVGTASTAINYTKDLSCPRNQRFSRCRFTAPSDSGLYGLVIPLYS